MRSFATGIVFVVSIPMNVRGLISSTRAVAALRNGRGAQQLMRLQTRTLVDQRGPAAVFRSGVSDDRDYFPDIIPYYEPYVKRYWKYMRWIIAAYLTAHAYRYFNTFRHQIQWSHTVNSRGPSCDFCWTNHDSYVCPYVEAFPAGINPLNKQPRGGKHPTLHSHHDWLHQEPVHWFWRLPKEVTG